MANNAPDTEFLFGLFEALLLASGEPLTISAIAEVMPPGYDDLEGAFSNFLEAFSRRNPGIQVQKVAGGYRLVTRAKYAPYIKQLNTIIAKSKLSKAACETLAVVAYRQPVTIPEIEAIRGVDSSGVIRTLMEKKLVRVLGKKKAPGKPLLYGTTSKFLVEFGLDTLEDLPELNEFQQELLPDQPGDLEPEGYAPGAAPANYTNTLPFEQPEETGNEKNGY